MKVLCPQTAETGFASQYKLVLFKFQTSLIVTLIVPFFVPEVIDSAEFNTLSQKRIVFVSCIPEPAHHRADEITHFT